MGIKYIWLRYIQNIPPQRRKRMDLLKKIPFEGWRRLCLVRGELTVHTLLGLDASAEITLDGRRRGNWVPVGHVTRKCLGVTFPVNPKQTLCMSVSISTLTHPGVEIKKSDLSCCHSFTLFAVYVRISRILANRDGIASTLAKVINYHPVCL